MTKTAQNEVIVVGGGLAGLAAATYLARGGHTVTLYEKSSTIGGRAVTQIRGEHRFNLGPHALYRKAEGVEVLRELGVRFNGGVPSASGGYAVSGGVKHTLPGGLVSLLTTGLLGLPGKFETARLLAGVQKIDVAPIQHTTVREWLDRNLRQPDVRRLVQALFRLTTYANDPERQGAGAAVRQLQAALSGNVLYIDGGWQVLVDGLRATAEGAGVQIVAGARVVAVDHDAAVRGVRLADGSSPRADAAIIAASPAEAAELVGVETPLRSWAEQAIPARAACLDVALSRLPQPRATFALGVDQPLYLSVHSASAKLAPAGGATIHVAKYLGAEPPADPKSVERELEGLLDLVQPGWRAAVVERRFLPNMIVCHSILTAATGGTAGRPGPAVPGVANLYVVGDWVGPEGLLADASLASAKRAADLISRGAAVSAAAA